MYDLPNNNLGFLDNNPIYVHNNFSSLPVKQLVDEISAYKKKHGSSCPETDALKFYLTNLVWINWYLNYFTQTLSRKNTYNVCIF